MVLPLLALLAVQTPPVAPPVAAPASAPSTFGVPYDARLGKAVKVERRFGLASEAVADLAQGTGVALSVAPSMKNLKAVVLTGPDRPASDTMRDLADLYDAEWKSDGNGGWRLIEDAKAAALRAMRVEAEDKAEHAGLEKELRRLARVAPRWGNDPSGDMSRAWQAANNIPDADKDEKAAAWAAYYADWGRGGLSLPTDRVVGDFLSSLDEGGWRQLFAGEFLWGSTDPAPGGRKIAKWNVERYDQNGRSFAPMKDTLRAFMRYDPEEGKLAFAYAQEGENSRSWSGSTDALGHGEGVSNDDPFLKHLSAWRSPVTKGTDPILDTVAKPGVPPATLPWFGDFDPPITLADHLARLHDEFGVPVVGEALRQTDFRRHRVGFGEATLRAALLDWLGEYAPGTVRTVRRALLFRPAGYWRARRAEPDEFAARRLEASGGKRLDAYAALAGSFTPAQERAAASLAWRVDSGPFASPLLLQLWRALTLTERTALLEGKKVGARSGLPLDRIFAEAVFTGAMKGAMLRRFDGPEVRWDGLALFGSRGGVTSQEMVYFADGSGRSGAPGSRTMVRETLVVLVGDAPDSGIELSCRLPGGKATPGRVGAPGG